MADEPRYSLLTSGELLSRARKGDRHAVSVLFGRHVPLLRRWAHGRLPHWARRMGDTADLVQDAVMNTFKRLNGFDHRGEKALQRYLRQAVHNRILDTLRRVDVRAVTEELSEDEVDRGASPLSVAISGQESERYRAALQTLKDDDRALIVGRIELGYNYEQLAMMSGRPSPDAARVALKRALARLVDEIRREE